MLVRCIANTTQELGTIQPGASIPQGFDLTQYVTKGREYHILGLSLSRIELNALVAGDPKWPWWLPVGLFDFSPRRLPDHWVFAVLEPAAASGAAPATINMARWGYEALVTDPEHHRGIQEREPADLELFFRELDREIEASEGAVS